MMLRRPNVSKAVLLAVALAWTTTLSARTLMVGEDQQFKLPSAAIAAAGDGDTIAVKPGIYYDCASIKQNRLILEGSGPGAVITDKTCADKGLLITQGDDITIRNLTLQRARVPDGNGAGVRAEGGHLTIINTRFFNNENGILSAQNSRAAIEIMNSEFVSNGFCGAACAHAIYIGHIAKLVVEHTRIAGTKDGHGVKSRALHTEVLDCDISDGSGGTSSYLIDIPNGGTAIIIGNTLEKGPKSGNLDNAIMIGEEGVDQPTDEIIIKNNHLTNDEGDRSTTFVNNITATPAQLSGNIFVGQVRALVGNGSVR